MALFRSSKGKKDAEAAVLEHGRTLHEQGRYEQLIDYYEHLPYANVTPNVVADLARAYANYATQKADEVDAFDPLPRDLLTHAVDLMESVADKLDDTSRADYFLGKSLLMLDLPAQARGHLEALVQAGEGGEAAQLLAYCDEMLAAPLHVTSFRERAQAAWRRLEADDAAIRRAFECGRDEEAFALVDDALVDVTGDFLLTYNEVSNRFELVLSPEHERLNLYKLAYFRWLAPASFLEHWDIVLGLQAHDGARYETGKRVLFSDDISVWPEFSDAEGYVTLKAYSKGLARELAESPQVAYDAFLALADETVGEVRLMRCLDGATLLETPLEERPMDLVELRGQLEVHLAAASPEPLDSVDACLDTEFAFTRMPQADGQSADGERGDTFIGTSCCPELVDEFWDGETYLADAALSCGIVVGWLFFPHGMPIAVGEAGEYVTQLLDETLDALMAAIGDETALFIGESIGTTYCYIDVVVWDFGAFIEAARGVLATMPVIDVCAFHTFRRGVASYALKGSYR